MKLACRNRLAACSRPILRPVSLPDVAALTSTGHFNRSLQQCNLKHHWPLAQTRPSTDCAKKLPRKPLVKLTRTRPASPSALVMKWTNTANAEQKRPVRAAVMSIVRIISSSSKIPAAQGACRVRMALPVPRRLPERAAPNRPRPASGHHKRPWWRERRCGRQRIRKTGGSCPSFNPCDRPRPRTLPGEAPTSEFGAKGTGHERQRVAHPTLPSSEIATSCCASIANSMGSA